MLRHARVFALAALVALVAADQGRAGDAPSGARNLLAPVVTGAPVVVSVPVVTVPQVVDVSAGDAPALNESDANATVAVSGLSLRTPPVSIILPPHANHTNVTVAPTLPPTPTFNGSTSGSGSGYEIDDIDIKVDDLFSSSTSGSNGSAVGDYVGDFFDIPATVTPPRSTQPSKSAGSGEAGANDINAKRQKDEMAGTGGLLSTTAMVMAVAGCAAIVIGAVVMRRRSEQEEEPENPFENPPPESIDLRRTSSGVYSDPLGTRFSSIVMITPNGEGVCIL